MENKLKKSRSCLEQVLRTLADQQKNRNYIQAQKLKNEARTIQRDIQNLEKKQIILTQRKQKEDIAQMQEKEMTEFYDKWKQRLSQLQRQSQQALKQQKQRQLNDYFLSQRAYLQERKQYHDSGIVIQLLKKQQKLSKLQKFKQAHQIQTERIKLLHDEKQAHKKLQTQKWKIKGKQLRLKQESQRQTLNRKLKAKIEQQRLQMEKEEQMLIKKHKNILRQFKSQKEKQNLAQSGLLKNSIYTVHCYGSASTKPRSQSNFRSPRGLNKNTK